MKRTLFPLIFGCYGKMKTKCRIDYVTCTHTAQMWVKKDFQQFICLPVRLTDRCFEEKLHETWRITKSFGYNLTNKSNNE